MTWDAGRSAIDNHHIPTPYIEDSDDVTCRVCNTEYHVVLDPAIEEELMDWRDGDGVFHMRIPERQGVPEFCRTCDEESNGMNQGRF